ncbi:BQ2448_3235 [Microbotryum intermedium]|uniref:BQ2448_3235 protein n=1 Tax=Microbotryum intermedium TaxID=269621 RepID=A0A238FEL5_9BASI|nr:BQ2448_3235 [Microbotryum intermedium]
MASMVDDFAATTTIGERIAAPTQHAVRAPKTGSQGPIFGVPPKLEIGLKEEYVSRVMLLCCLWVSINALSAQVMVDPHLGHGHGAHVLNETPFCLLAKSARGAGAAALVAQATTAPGVYVFGELLAMPSIQDLATSEGHAPSHQLLKIFAYGTWSDYNQNRSSLPELNSVQEVKLRHLTIVSLAMQARVSRSPVHRCLPIEELNKMREYLDSIPKLEDLLIEGIYAGVFNGRLDQHRARVEITSSIGRDVRSDSPPKESKASSESTRRAQVSTSVPPTTAMEVDPSAAAPAPSAQVDTTSLIPESSHSIASMTTSLSSWIMTISTLLTSLDRHLAQLTADGINELRSQQEHDKAVQAVLDENGKESTITGGILGKGKERERRAGAGAQHGLSEPSGGWGLGATRLGVCASSAAAAPVGGVSGDDAGDMNIDSTGRDALGSLTRNAKSLAGRLRKRGRT